MSWRVWCMTSCTGVDTCQVSCKTSIKVQVTRKMSCTQSAPVALCTVTKQSFKKCNWDWLESFQLCVIFYKGMLFLSSSGPVPPLLINYCTLMSRYRVSPWTCHFHGRPIFQIQFLSQHQKGFTTSCIFTHSNPENLCIIHYAKELLQEYILLSLSLTLMSS